MIKAIIFDCFGVLTADLWREFCSTLPPGEGLERAHELNHLYNAKLISLEDFFQGVAQATGRPVGEVQKVVYNGGDPSKNILLFDYIGELKKTYKIGLLSNVGSNWIRDSFLTPEEKRLFDEMVFSFDIGLTKPDPRTFEIIAQKLGIQPSEAVMVDDIERYCEAARSLGMQAIYYQNFNQFKQDLEKILASNPDN